MKFDLLTALQDACVQAREAGMSDDDIEAEVATLLDLLRDERGDEA